MEVPLDVIGYQIEAGHNIEVSISPTYWPQIWPDKEIVNLIVDFSHSELLLPVINDFNEVRLKYEQSETAAPLEKKLSEMDTGHVISSRNLQQMNGCWMTFLMKVYER